MAAAHTRFNRFRRTAGRVSSASVIGLSHSDDEYESDVELLSDDDQAPEIGRFSQNYLLALSVLNNHNGPGTSQYHQQLASAKDTMKWVMVASQSLAKDQSVQSKILEALEEHWDIVDVPGGATVPVFDGPQQREEDGERVEVVQSSDEEFGGVRVELAQHDEDAEEEELRYQQLQQHGLRVAIPLEPLRHASEFGRTPRASATLLGKALAWVQTSFNRLLRSLHLAQQGEQQPQEQAQPRAEAQPQAVALNQKNGRQAIPGNVVRSQEFMDTVVAVASLLVLVYGGKQIIRKLSSNSGNKQ